MKKTLSIMYIRHTSVGNACMGRVYLGNAFNSSLIIGFHNDCGRIKSHPESDGKKQPTLDDYSIVQTSSGK